MSDLSPDSVQPLLGYRIMEIDNNRLSSPTWINPRHFFALGTNTAVCLAHQSFVAKHMLHAGWGIRPHDEAATPGPRCSCGFYAYHDLPAQPKHARQVLTLVAAWGNIEVHRDGFRAQHMKVLAVVQSPHPLLFVPLQRIATAYQVPIISYEQTQQIAANPQSATATSVIGEAQPAADSWRQHHPSHWPARKKRRYAVNLVLVTAPAWIISAIVLLATGSLLAAGLCFLGYTMLLVAIVVASSKYDDQYRADPLSCTGNQ